MKNVVKSAIESITLKGLKTDADVLLIDLLGHPPKIQAHIREAFEEYRRLNPPTNKDLKVEWVY